MMSALHKNRAASHGRTNFLDQQSVSLVAMILANHKRVMANLDSIDKWPNIDGYLEVQDSLYQSIGKLEAQVKTLPKNHKFKYQCKTSFLAYCRDVAQIPVLLLCVDLPKERIYWLHIDSGFVSGLNLKSNQGKKTISLDPSRYIDRTTESYIDEWETIICSHHERLKSYDKIVELYKELLEASNISVGKREIYYANIHIFLDQINNMLDSEFGIVKKQYYLGSWKIGLAYYIYDSRNVAYMLYPIPIDYNDVQIKRVDNSFHERIQKEGTDFKLDTRDNPIEAKPKEYAQEFVQSKVYGLIRDKLLEHGGSKFLANEFVFSYFSSSTRSLGIEKADFYSIGYIDGILRLGKLTEPVGFTLHEVAYPFYIFYELFSYLKSRGILEVHRTYKRPMLNIEDVHDNMVIFFNNFEDTYSAIVNLNFPQIAEQLSAFKDADLILVHYYVEDENNIYKGPPRYWLSVLKSTEYNQSRRLIVKRGIEDEQDLVVKENGHFIYNGKQHKPVLMFSSSLPFASSNTPMLDLVYKIIKIRLDEYFRATRVISR